MYMHVMGSGDAAQLATAARAALLLSKTPLKAAKTKPNDLTVPFDTKALDAVIGATGKVDGRRLQDSFAPKYTVIADGTTLPASTGMSTGLAFQPLGKKNAAITGDFALLAGQVNPVIRALRAHGIEAARRTGRHG